MRADEKFKTWLEHEKNTLEKNLEIINDANFPMVLDTYNKNYFNIRLQVINEMILMFFPTEIN